MQPLNGVKTLPLTKFSLSVLSDLRIAPQPTQEVNPGVVDRLLRGALVRTVDLPSPYKAHKGGNCPHLQITDAGRALVSKGLK